MADKINKTILFVCPTGSLVAGGETSNLELIKYLDKSGYTIKVVTAWRGELNDTLNDIGINNISGDYPWWKYDKRDEVIHDSVTGMRGFAKIIEYIGSVKPNLIITNTLNIPWGALAAASANIPHIWIQREFPIEEFSYLDTRMKFIEDYSNIVMANSKELAKYDSDRYGLDAGYFYSYVDASGLSLASDQGLPTRLVSLNGMFARKNQMELLSALVILRKRNPDFNTKVILMGHKEKVYYQKLQKFIADKKLEDLVEFKDFSSTPWDSITRNDILVQTSLSESIGRTTTEGMKLGIPVIASDIQGHKEAFSLGGGTLYRSGDAGDLALKIEQLLKAPELSISAAKDAQRKALRNLSIEACNAPFLKAVESLNGKDNPRNELEVLGLVFKKYIENREELIVDQSKTINTLQKDIEVKDGNISALKNDIQELGNSQSYKLGNIIVRIVRVFVPKRLIK